MSKSIPETNLAAKVICLGEILIDRLTSNASSPTSRETISYYGGAPANVACSLVKLGTPAAFIGCIGQDQSGAELLELLKNTGVDISGVQIHPTAPTREVWVTSDDDGDRSFVGFSGDRDIIFADTLLSSSELPVKLFEDAEFLVLGTLGLAAEVTAQAIDRALDLAEANFVKIIIDVNWRPIFWSNPEQAPTLINDLLLRADFVKFSAEEAEFLYQTSSPRAIAQELDHLEGVIVTDGGKPCRYYLGEYTGIETSFEVKVTDTTGAGDGFLAGFLHQLCQISLDQLQNSQTRSEIIKYASAVGAITTMGMGAIAPQPNDLQVQNFLAQNLRDRI